MFRNVQHLQCLPLAGLLVLTSGCALSKRPPVTTIAQPPPKLPVSQATIGAKISTHGLAAYLETVVPREHHDSGDGETIQYKDDPCEWFGGSCPVRIELCRWSWKASVHRTAFQVIPVPAGLGVKATYTLGGSVKMRGPVCPSISVGTNPDGKVDLTVTTKPKFNEVYGFEPNVGYDNWQWSVRPGIRAFNIIPITFGTLAGNQIDKSLAKIRDDTEESLRRQLNFRPNVQKLWDELHQPIKSGDDIWLSVKPLSLHATPLISDQDYARIYATLRSRNELVIGERPAEQDVVALPILLPGEPNGGFELTNLARVEFKTIEERAKTQWIGKTIEMDWGRLVFRNFKIYQSNQRLVVGAKVSVRPKNGLYVDGWLWLHGVPAIEDNQLFLKDLNYNAQTNNPLLQGIAWLFREPARRELENKLRFDIRGPLDNLITRLNNLPPATVGDFGKFNLTVSNIDIMTPIADARGLIIPVSAKGVGEVSFFPYGEGPQ